MTYKISKNKPLPPARTLYPWQDMEVGDSFLVPGPHDKASGGKVRSAACDYGRRHGLAFSVRVEGDGLRVWRWS